MVTFPASAPLLNYSTASKGRDSMVKLKKGALHGGPMSEQDEPASEPVDGEEESVLEEEVELTPEELLAQAEAKAEAAEKEISYRDAEIQNIQRRLAKEKSELIQYSSMNLSRRMLSVMDDVDRALSAIPKEITNECEPILEGLRLLRERLWSELSAAGVVAMDSKGKEFDPNMHEALTTIPASDENPSGIVIEVIEAGYMFKERLLRAAKVVVAS